VEQAFDERIRFSCMEAIRLDSWLVARRTLLTTLDSLLMTMRVDADDNERGVEFAMEIHRSLSFHFNMDQEQ
jgi:hypothetical protein